MKKNYLPTVEDSDEIKRYLIEEMDGTNNKDTIKTNKNLLKKLSKDEIYFLFWLLEYKYREGYDDAIDEILHNDGFNSNLDDDSDFI